MGQDADILFLRWLNGQPLGRGRVNDSPYPQANVEFLVDRGLVVPAPDDFYVITKEGKHYQDGE